MEELKGKVANRIEGGLDDDLWNEIIAKRDLRTWSVDAVVGYYKGAQAFKKDFEKQAEDYKKQAEDYKKQAEDFKKRLTIGGLLKASAEHLTMSVHMRGPTGSSVSQYYQNAEFSIGHLELSEVPVDDSKMLNFASVIMSKLDQPTPLTYGSEFDVQDHVHAMISDALTIVNHLLKEESNPERSLIARREAGFFTNKPDHSVILDKSSGAPVLCIETKMPFEDNRGPHKKVLGQVFDYVSWMRNLGHPNPFAVLTTFNQTWITWDACDTLSSDIAKELDRFNRKSLALLRERLPTSTTAKTTSPAKPEEPSSSPASGKPIKKRRKTEARSLALFGPIEPKNMVTALVNAILCSLRNFVGEALVPTLLPGTNLQRQVLTMNKDDYFFRKLNVTVKAWNESTMKSEKVFHIISLLGVGRTSKAFRAVSENGYECVLKVYVRTHDETNNYQRLKSKDFQKAAQHSTSKERRLYKNIYNMSVPTITLKGLKCLILPYFEPVPAGKRIESLPQIKTTLETKFQKKKRIKSYYRFVDTDIAWRHCGFLNGQLYLFDLADLEECTEVNTDQTFDGYVTHHLERLRERATNAS